MIKDIQLQKTSNNTYDWKFNGLDVEIGIGVERLQSAVKHAILLREGEMIQDLYYEKGCTVYRYLPHDNSTNNRNFIAESIIASCKEIEGVRDATVEIKEVNGNGVAITDLKITRNNGEEVIIDGI